MSLKKNVSNKVWFPAQGLRLAMWGCVWLCLALSSGGARTAFSEESVACANGTRFSVARNFPLENDPQDVVVGDFNKDGFLDLAISSSSVFLTRRISIYAGNGRGEFANVYNIPLSSLASRLAQGDFNNDGLPDLVTTVIGDNSGVVVSLGRGDWTFATSVIPIASLRYLAGIAVADFNADGKADIAFSGEGKLIVMAGNGDGTFARSGVYSSASPPGSITAADFSGDGKPDLVVFGEEFDQKPTLFINDGTGKFQAGVAVNVNGGGGGLTNAAGDLNGDGRADLALVRGTTQQERGVTILFSTGVGGFGEPVQIPLNAYNYPRTLRIADVNGDGKPDLIAFEADSNRVSILLSNGAGAFSVRASYGLGAFPVAGVVGDFDRDGKVDIAAANSDLTLSVLTGLGDGQFLAPRALDQADRLIRATALADVNGDGRLDAVSALGNQGGVLVAYGDGAGGFGASKIYPTGRDNSDLAIADFNKDGRPDIVVVGGALQSAGSVSLLLGTATGDFAPGPRDLNAGLTPSTVIAADLNRDGNQDLVVGNFGSNNVSISLGDGRGDFAAAVNIPVGRSPSGIAAGDFDNDGRLDLAVANYGEATLTILKGDGAGGFNSSSVAVTATPLLLAAADFNGDGKLDLAVIHRNESTQQNLSILLGNGDGSFRAPLRFATDNYPRSMAVGDFTGDGNLDLALTEILFLTNTGAADHVSIYAGDGAGNVARATNLSVREAIYLAAGDLNRDGLIDLTVTTLKGISSLLAACAPPPVNAVASVSAASYLPIALAPDSIAAAFGSQLAATTLSATSLPLPTELAGTRVRVKDAAGAERLAPLFFVSPTQINYLVPPGTASGLAIVTVAGGGGQTTTGVILITPTLPGLFTANADGGGPPAGYLLRIKGNGAQVTEPLVEFDLARNAYVPRPIDFFSDSPSQPDQIYLVLFGTGLHNRSSLASVEAGIENIRFDVIYAGLQGDFVGLDQINVRVPRLSDRPLTDFVVVVDGKASNRVRLAFK
jgi:uncharacterized protein (TIGR03437 family)